jgi:surface antigen
MCSFGCSARASLDRTVYRGRLYRESLGQRLWRRLRPGGLALAAGVSAFALGGCSFSYQLDNTFGNGHKEPEMTGSIRPAPGRTTNAGLPPESDLAAARAAVREILAKGGKDTSMPWENPKTGARGTITPLASAYSQDGLTCRDFLASYVHGGTEAWLQGEACRANEGAWEVRNIKPWQRT